MELETVLYVIPDEESITPTNPTSTATDIALIVGVAVGASVLVALIIFGGIYCVRKRAKIEQQIEDSDSEEGRSENI